MRVLTCAKASFLARASASVATAAVAVTASDVAAGPAALAFPCGADAALSGPWTTCPAEALIRPIEEQLVSAMNNSDSAYEQTNNVPKE
jgi:hypothetical protein